MISKILSGCSSDHDDAAGARSGAFVTERDMGDCSIDFCIVCAGWGRVCGISTCAVIKVAVCRPSP